MEFDEEKFSIDFGRHLQDIREGKKIRIGKLHKARIIESEKLKQLTICVNNSYIED